MFRSVMLVPYRYDVASSFVTVIKTYKNIIHFIIIIIHYKLFHNNSNILKVILVIYCYLLSYYFFTFLIKSFNFNLLLLYYMY